MKTSISTILAFLWISATGFSQSIHNSPGFDIGTGINLTATSVMISAKQTDGKILIGGRIGNYNGTSVGGFCRLNTDGSIDNGFEIFDWDYTNNWDPFITAITIQTDGKILVGGTFTDWNGVIGGGLIRLNTDGTVDTTFDVGTGFLDVTGFQVPYVYSISVQSDGKIVVGGVFSEYNGTVRNCLARLDTDGSLDTSYNPGQFFSIPGPSQLGFYSAAIQPDDKLILGGSFTDFNGTTLQGLARLNTNGSLDIPFSTAADFGIGGGAYKIALQPDNKVMIGGYFTTVDGIPHLGVARLLATGALDNSFNTSSNITTSNGSSVPVPQTIAFQADGKILLGGDYVSYDNLSRDYLIRLEPNGDLDYGFYLEDISGQDDYVNTVLSITNDKVFIGGNFTTIQNESRNHLAMLDICGNYSVSAIDNCGDYLWPANNTTYTTSGTYLATLSNESGCDSVCVLKLFIPEIQAPQEICIVGLDSLTSRNRVVWEKPLSDAIDSFYVYRETSSANVYEQIGAVGYDDLAVFIDASSNPAVQPFRYAVSILDTCGIETPLSTNPHRTIHLTINQGVGDTWNLIWSSYEGISVPTYNIYRGSTASTMSLLTTVSGGTNSYSDLNVVGDAYYQIEFVNPNDCDPSKSANYNLSRSNITANNGLGIVSNSTNEFSLAPNPCNDQITLTLPVATGTITVYSIIGTKVLETEVKNQQENLQTGELANGMYRAVYYSGDRIFEQLFIKQ